MRHVIFLILITLCPCNLLAQSDFIDSIRTSFSYKPKVDLRFDTRNSFITNLRVRILGVKIGLDYNRKSRIGLSYNWLGSDINQTFIHDSDVVNTELKLWYVSPYFEYTFYNQKKWELSTLLSFGLGRSKYKFEDIALRNQTFAIYEPYMLGQYSLLKWLGLSFGVGYRLLLHGHQYLPKNFSTPIYVLKLKLIPGQLIL
ncbi:MAG: hypothetical protein MRY83_00520 [Flavobacteriales bacterium]|nr:hypothetical protein [Flavobacteriales bacterium]